MAKRFSKMYGNKDERNPNKSMSRCLSALITSLPQEQAAKTNMLSVVRIQQKEYLVLCTVTSRLNVGIYCLPTT